MAKKKKSKSSNVPKKTEKQSSNKNLIFICCIAAFVVLLVIISIIVLVQNSGNNENSSVNSQTPVSSSNSSNSSVQTNIDQSKNYFADIDIKDYGKITVALDAKAAPVTVENFVSLANSGFYDGLTFHRIMKGFMMQGGDPNADGTGGSEKTIFGEFSANGYNNTLSHTRGAISMARNSVSMDSASSQFFIVQTDDNTFLDGQYAAFGYVIEGMEIVDKICAEAEPIDNNGLIAADKQPVINSIKIRVTDVSEVSE